MGALDQQLLDAYARDASLQRRLLACSSRPARAWVSVDPLLWHGLGMEGETHWACSRRVAAVVWAVTDQRRFQREGSELRKFFPSLGDKLRAQWGSLDKAKEPINRLRTILSLSDPNQAAGNLIHLSRLLDRGTTVDCHQLASWLSSSTDLADYQRLAWARSQAANQLQKSAKREIKDPSSPITTVSTD